MLTEKLKELIANSNWAQMQKNVGRGFIDRVAVEQDKDSEDRMLIERVAREKKLSEIIVSTDEVKIYTVAGKDDWDVKYPFRSIYLDEKKEWQRSHTVSPTLDVAFLVYLQYKQLGSNSQFVDFAMKMLSIQADE